ncbi:uncharacterized protein BX664DRAFT_325661 [Halteromyces radiatus]|uniref:uncharacterized protein n=1 Tax=Halteromyces radiatus TaxID=101107 RepID=UPI00221E5D22|nr:uncharacterized protein BX664DRAFT_325661 [Halteromyces radiatus]KAI8097150.1 hypothetical protein BX664DRAFT_325661 [Halteromyces radiatus]
MEQQEQKVALITGVNYLGVSYGIAKRLLELFQQQGHSSSLTIIFASRNYTRTAEVRDYLLQSHPYANIDIVVLDLNSIDSILACCQVIREKYSRIDYLFLNAGYLPSSGIRWSTLFYMLWKDPIGLVETSVATIQASLGEVNQDNIGKVFACNVFGHYVMMRELECLLTKGSAGTNNDKGGRVIWTSSSTAFSECFDINDWQGLKCELPYESSKWACDLLAIASNEYFLQHQLNITSFSVSPGVVASAIGNLPLWLVYFRSLFHYVFRLCGVESQNITGYRGSISAVFVALQPLDVLNTMLRYTSATNRWGTSFVKPKVLDHLELEQAYTLLEHCEHSYQILVRKRREK